MGQRLIAEPGLPVLLRREWRGCPSAPVAYVGHSQTTHSEYLVPFCKMFHELGWTVATGDLRGHGGSVGDRAPRAHLDPEEGWEHWIADFRCHLEKSFEGVEWSRRVILAPNISALLVLECLKRDRDLARTIVLMSPPGDQPVLSRLGVAYMKARMLLRPHDHADEQTLHNFYSFLGAHLKERQHLADVISRDRDLVDRIVSDPTAWTTPTLGYWLQIFQGSITAWARPGDLRLREDQRVLVLYGEEDAMSRSGGLVLPIIDWFRSVGVEDCHAERIPNGRHAFFIDGCAPYTFDRIRKFIETGPAPGDAPASSAGLDYSVDTLTSEVFDRFGIPKGDALPSAEELVEICYDAVNDETRWIEVLYRFLMIAGHHEGGDDADIDRVIARVMPHLERAFDLNRQVAAHATMGVILQELIGRLQLGTAIVNDNMDILSFNEAFAAAARRLLGADAVPSAEQMRAMVRNATRRPKGNSAELALVHDGRPVGVLIRPRAMVQTALRRNGPSSIVVLRLPDEDAASAEMRAELLEAAFGLTRHEALIALSVARGDSPEELAERMGLSINTVRTHLKRCYVKMGVRGQNALTARLLSGPLGWLGGAAYPGRK